MGFRLIDESNSEVSSEEVRHVRLRVCGTARDAGEARLMLDMLGLLPEKNDGVDKPEWYELCVRQKHRLTPENTTPGERGGRKCIACTTETAPTPVPANPPGARQNPDFCRNGHEKKVYGYHTRSNGQRECQRCYEERKKRETTSRSGRHVGPWRKKCVNGHAWTDENTWVRQSGKRACGTCLDGKKKDA